MDLKTLGGLLPVDLIVTRQDDSYCDPLELRPDSPLGIPGVAQAVRSDTDDGAAGGYVAQTNLHSNRRGSHWARICATASTPNFITPSEPQR